MEVPENKIKIQSNFLRIYNVRTKETWEMDDFLQKSKRVIRIVFYVLY